MRYIMGYIMGYITQSITTPRLILVNLLILSQNPSERRPLAQTDKTLLRGCQYRAIDAVAAEPLADPLAELLTNTARRQPQQEQPEGCAGGVAPDDDDDLLQRRHDRTNVLHPAADRLHARDHVLCAGQRAVEQRLRENAEPDAPGDLRHVHPQKQLFQQRLQHRRTLSQRRLRESGRENAPGCD